MPHPLDGPQVDERPPGYGCGWSFGMLGPSRLVVLSGYVPEGFEEAAGGMCVPYLLEGSGSPFWYAQWKGVFESFELSIFLSLLNPHTGAWRLNGDLNATPPTASGGATRSFTNFTWQFPSIVLSDDTGSNWGNLAVYRIAEWQTVTARFPECLFPEDV